MGIKKRNWLLKKLRAIRKKGNHEVYFEDEVHFQRSTSIIRSWSLKGVVQEVKSPPVKEKTSFFGAMGADNGQLIIMEANPFCAVGFRKFLETVLKKASTKRKILLVLDNARYHHAKMNKGFIEKIKHRMELIYLPPYSPELNPIEFLWKKTRREVTHNRYFESLGEQRTSLKSFFRRFSKPNKELKRLSANI